MTDTTAPRGTERLEDSVRDLVGLGRMWAAHGLNIGSEALKASARSLEVTSRFLQELRTQLQDEAAEGEAPEPAPEA